MIALLSLRAGAPSRRVGGARYVIAIRTITSTTRRCSPSEVTPERTNNKVWASADEAVADLQSGKTVFSSVCLISLSLADTELT